MLLFHMPWGKNEVELTYRHSKKSETKIRRYNKKQTMTLLYNKEFNSPLSLVPGSELSF